MRSMPMIAVMAVLSLAGCGSDKEKTVVVQPPASTQSAPPQNNTVVVPQSGGTKVCPQGYTTC
jgi:predicted small lipoprotein YifL